MSHKTEILVKSGRIFLQKKMSSDFSSDVLQLHCLSAAFYLAELSPTTYPLLQLQLRSAGSLHAAFRNLHESQSWGRAVVGHQRETRGHFPHKIWPNFTKIAVLCDVLMCIVRFSFLKAAGQGQSYIVLFNETKRGTITVKRVTCHPCFVWM